MRKIFWCSLAVAIAAAGSVYLASRSVERTPFGVMGHALVAVGGEEASSAPSGGEEAPPPPEPAPVGNETPTPAPTDDPLLVKPGAVVAVADPSTQGYIILDEGTAQGQSGPLIPMPNATPIDVAALPVPAVQPPPAPAVMPYCRDGEDSSSAHMPYADEEGQLQQVDDRETDQQMVSPPDLKCPEDQDYHSKHPGCTYTGGAYPGYPICPPAPEVKTDKGNNAPKMPTTEKKGNEESQKKDVDTMEFRKSDFRFQHFVPRPF
jgi:hypothetical protein